MECLGLFQSTPPVRGATGERRHHPVQHPISIHAPREGGDGPESGSVPGQPISIHAPREGGDWFISNGLTRKRGFQSTPPVRGATRALDAVREIVHGISIHAPREGGDHLTVIRGGADSISIHAPREGGDIKLLWADYGGMIFQSTPPVRGATLEAGLLSRGLCDFNPRPP